MIPYDFVIVINANMILHSLDQKILEILINEIKMKYWMKNQSRETRHNRYNYQWNQESLFVVLTCFTSSTRNASTPQCTMGVHL